MFVIKNDGSQQPFDITKIQKQVKFITSGLSITEEDVMEKFSLTLRNNLTTSSIQYRLIDLCVKNIGVDTPEWNKAAGRAEMWNVYREVYKRTGFSVNEWQKHMEWLTQKGFYRKEVMKKIYELGIESDFMDFGQAQNINLENNKDFDMVFSQVKALESKYIIKDMEGYIEYPFMIDIANAALLADTKEEFLKIFKLLQEKYISLATPFFRNLRRPGGNTISCFIGINGDFSAGIFKAWADIASISKNGGGVGWYMGKYRPGGTSTLNIVESNPITKWAKIKNDIIVSFNQAGVRAGALTLAYEWWQLDIMEFLEIKSEIGGDLREKSFDIFPQLIADKYFARAVKEKRTVYLFNHYEVRQVLGVDMTEMIDEDFEYWYEKIVDAIKAGDLKHYKEMKANQIWKKSLWSWIEIGDFYIVNKDNLNVANYIKNEEDLNKRLITHSANLCVTGDTKILTKEYGNAPIGELVESGVKEVTAWNGEEWSKTPIFRTDDGNGQHVLKVKLSNGAVIKATDYHKWYVVDTNKKNKIKEVRTHELKIGDKLEKFDKPILEFGNTEIKNPYLSGLLTADGNYMVSRVRLNLYNEKMLLANHLPKIHKRGYHTIRNDNNNFVYELYYDKKDVEPKYFVPGIEHKLDDVIKWLAGLLDGDGTVTNNNNAQSIQLTSINIEFLNEVRLLLLTLGIDSKVVNGMKEGNRELPMNNDNGDGKLYYCQASKRLIIPGNSINKLLDLGIKFNRLKVMKHNYNRDASNFVKVIGIEEVEDFQATYCGTEPKRNKLVFNGVLTGNCVESFSVLKEPKNWVEEVKDGKRYIKETDGMYHSCNLISMNMVKMMQLPEEEFEEVMYYAVKVVDKSIDLGTNPSKDGENTSKLLRNVGIGTIGVGDVMAYHNKMYDTEDGLLFLQNMIEKVSYYSYKASVRLAKELGSYPWFNPKNYDKLIGQTTTYLNELSRKNGNNYDWEALRQDILKDGIRNFYLNAIAPNTSTSLLVGVLPSYLPAFNKFNFRTLSDMSVPELPVYIKDKYWSYRTRYQYKASDIIKATRMIQPFIDTGISMEMDLDPAKDRIDEISEAILDGFIAGDLKAVYYSSTNEAGCVDCKN